MTHLLLQADEYEVSEPLKASEVLIGFRDAFEMYVFIFVALFALSLTWFGGKIVYWQMPYRHTDSLYRKVTRLLLILLSCSGVGYLASGLLFWAIPFVGSAPRGFEWKLSPVFAIVAIFGAIQTSVSEKKKSGYGKEKSEG